jgi:hypothetical protein
MQAATVQRLGDILVAQGAVSRARLETAVAQAYGRLGQALHSHGLISGPALAKAVAAQHALPVIDLGRTPPVAKLFLPRDYPHYITHHPCLEGDGRFLERKRGKGMGGVAKIG